MHDTIFFSACDLINLYKSKKLSPVENLKNTFDVIKKFNPKLNAFISIAEKKAMKQAKLSELHYLNSTARKLEGIPFGAKDVIDVKQEKTMNGSKLFERSEVKSKIDKFWRNTDSDVENFVRARIDIRDLQVK